MPSGALSLAGRFTTSADWLAMLGLYVMARLAGFADQWMFNASGALSGHTLMHLLLAAVIGWAAYCVGVRVRVAPRSRGSALPSSAAEPTQRRTSLNTSS